MELPKPNHKGRSKKAEYPYLIKSISIPFYSWFISGYDLSLDSLFANFIAKTFFPSSDFTYSLLAVYGVISLSLLARFGGALTLGRFGDKHQRKAVVVICLILLTFGMFGSLFLVFYNNFFSAIVTSSLFIFTRILVGFSIGGLWPTASVWGLENLVSNRFKPSKDRDEEQKYQESIRKDLLPHGGLMQFGFHLGWFTSALLLWQWMHLTKFTSALFLSQWTIFNSATSASLNWMNLTTASDIIKFGWTSASLNWMNLTTASDIIKFGSLSIIGCIMSIVLILFCFWKMDSSNLLEVRKVFLEKSKMIDELGSMKTLFTNHKDAIINLWLIMNGLFFLYYPSTVITTKVLTINRLTPPDLVPIFIKNIVSNTFFAELLRLGPMTINIFLLVIVLIAHGLPVFLYWRLDIWRREWVITGITKCYLQLYKLAHFIYSRGQSRLGLTDGVGQQKILSKRFAKSDTEIKKISKQNLDIIIIILTGLLLLGIVSIGFIWINVVKTARTMGNYYS